MRVVRKDDTLYPIEVLDRKENCVLIHYVGYDSKHNEWKAKEDMVSTEERKQLYQPFNLYTELGYQVKLALDSNRRHEPDVQIEVPFDQLAFDGGLKQSGVFQSYSHGHEVYTISHFHHLDALLGVGWKCSISKVSSSTVIFWSCSTSLVTSLRDFFKDA